MGEREAELTYDEVKGELIPHGHDLKFDLDAILDERDRPLSLEDYREALPEPCFGCFGTGRTRYRTYACTICKGTGRRYD